jgi:hypothetical protein
MQLLQNKAIQTANFAFAVLLLSACSPRYDWREVRPAEGGWVASFPARVQSAVREIDLGGKRVSMAMHAARVDGVAFAIGIASLPEGSGEIADQAPASLKAAMLRNIQGTILREHVVTIQRSGKSLAPVPGSEIEADGKSGGEPVRLAARFAAYRSARGGQVVQIIVLGPSAELSRSVGHEAIETFMSSLRLD